MSITVEFSDPERAVVMYMCETASQTFSTTQYHYFCLTIIQIITVLG